MRLFTLLTCYRDGCTSFAHLRAMAASLATVALVPSWLTCCGIGSGALAPAAWCPRDWRAVVSIAVPLRPLRRCSFAVIVDSFAVSVDSMPVPSRECRSNEIIVLQEKSCDPECTPVLEHCSLLFFPVYCLQGRNHAPRPCFLFVL